MNDLNFNFVPVIFKIPYLGILLQNKYFSFNNGISYPVKYVED